MAIAFRAATSLTNSTTGTSHSITAPAGLQDGDLLIVTIAVRGLSGSPVGTLSGWTLLNGPQLFQGTNNFSWTYYKIASGEPASWTFSWAGGNGVMIYVCAAYSSVDNTTPIDASGFSHGNSSPLTAPSISPTGSSDMLVFVGASRDSGTVPTTPAGMTLRGSG